MKIIYAIAAYLLVLVFPVCTAKALPPPASDPEGLYSNKVGKSPEEVIRHYEQQAPTTSADFFTLALAHYAKADFPRALDLANRALPLQSDPSAQAVCLVLIAECHGGLGQYDLAAEAALHGLRLGPSDKNVEKALAALRYAYTTQAKDDVAAEAAKVHLMQLDPNFQRHPTIDWVKAGKVVVAMVIAAIVAITKAQQETGCTLCKETLGKSLEYFLEFAPQALLTAAESQ